MDEITQTFTAHHRRCDEEWAEAEQHASGGEWDEAGQALGRFLITMGEHLRAEEELLFPAFEAATGMREGPTAVMRSEHDQLRRLFKVLEAAVARGDADTFAGAGETMLVLMEQHNAKEESVLYPTCDEVLGGEMRLRAELDARLKARSR